MKKQERVLRTIMPLLEETYGPDRTRTILADARREVERLCVAHTDEPKAVKTHTWGKIYPCIGLYRALQASGVEAGEAVAFLDKSWSRMAEPDAASIRAMLKIPGLFKLMPSIFAWMTVHQFGEKAGFKATFYPTGRDRVKFDMTQCLYCEVCRREGVPELIVCFCHTDDVTDGHMHPRLRWNRTKIMGDGGDVCDFDLFITEKDK